MAAGQVAIAARRSRARTWPSSRPAPQAPMRSARPPRSSGAATPTRWSPAAREAPMLPIGIVAFSQAQALSTRNDDPEGASRPFDAERDGFVAAEGGAVLMLEKPRARPGPRRADLRRAGRLRRDRRRLPHHRPARGRRGRGAGDEDWLCARQGSGRRTSTTSTPTAPRRQLNDRAETAAIKTVFGEHAYQAGHLAPPSR